MVARKILAFFSVFSSFFLWLAQVSNREGVSHDSQITKNREKLRVAAVGY